IAAWTASWKRPSRRSGTPHSASGSRCARRRTSWRASVCSRRGSCAAFTRKTRAYDSAKGSPSRSVRSFVSTMRFTVATYNIHKGFSHARRMVIHELRERLHGLPADVLFLQEVIGVHERHATRYQDWPAKPQHEFIAGERWQEVCYGKNCVYQHGHHGNAVLSRFAVTSFENIDISAHPFESRGMLHFELSLPQPGPKLHCLNVHLGLFE